MTLIGLIVAFAAGLALGACYLAALWLTVRRLPTLRHPAVWIAASAALRLSLLLLGFHWVMGGDWQRLLACLLGFVVARLAATGWARSTGPKRMLSP